jgi:hypothetical protein
LGKLVFGKTIKSPAKEGVGQQVRKEHKKYFGEVFSKCVDQRKRSKLQWLHDTSQINAHNLNSVKQEISRYFRNKSENI